MDLLHYVPQRGYGSLYVAGNIEIAAKGKLTGSCCFLLNNSNHKILTMTYYDLWDHIIQQRSTNHLGGVDVDFYWREMTGKLLKHMHSHSAPDKQPLTEIYTYEYDYGERLVRVKHQLNNQSEVVLTENSYDDLGRLQTKKHHGNESLKSTYSYNIRNWLTSIGGLFSEQLTYNPCYNGNIGKMSWKFDAEYNMERRYSFYYDGLNRLKSAGYWDEEFNFYDTNYDYDKMGNLLTLSRWGTMEAREDFAKVDDLSFTYNGNQVKSIDDSTEDYITYTPLDFIDNAKEEEEYFYDNNGNLIKDLNKGIDEIQYNCLNLPNYITLHERNATHYLYSADGVKRRKEYGVWELFSIEPAFSSINMRNSLQKAGTGTNSIEFYSFVSNECIDYCGNIIYKNGVLDKVLTEEGYINFVNGAPVYHYYLKDHQGNIRVVMNQNGMKEGLNHYYPFGSLFGESSDSQEYKYGGKELDKVHGLNWYDFEARYYDSAIGRFHMMDPLCEKSYSWSPYSYCKDNPINRIDPDGKDDYVMTSNGKIYLKRKTRSTTDVLYASGMSRKCKQIDSNWKSITVKDRNLLKTMSRSRRREINTPEYYASTGSIYEAANIAKFGMENSNSEWTFEAGFQDDKISYAVGTNLKSNSVSFVSQIPGFEGFETVVDIHSHIMSDGTRGGSLSDIENAKSKSKRSWNVYFTPNGTMYEYNGEESQVNSTKVRSLTDFIDYIIKKWNDEDD